MRFSAYPGASNSWEDLLGLARRLEETGWDGIWLPDHLLSAGDRSSPYNEAWTTLAALAAIVPRIRLGVLVSANTFRHPALLAKMAASVDIISGGRLVLGLGAAWMETEHRTYGIPFFTAGERLARLEEACQVIGRLFTSDRATFQGRYYQLHDAPLVPKPLQKPRPPLLIGGGGERVTLRIVAQHADEWNVSATPTVVRQKAHLLDQYCEEIGRDPSGIRRSVFVTLALRDALSESGGDNGSPRTPLITGTADELKEVVREYATAGVEELILSPVHLGDARREKVDYTQFWENVAADFR